MKIIIHCAEGHAIKPVRKGLYTTFYSKCGKQPALGQCGACRDLKIMGAL